MRDENEWVSHGAKEILHARLRYLQQFKPTDCTLESLWRFARANDDDTRAQLQEIIECSDVLTSDTAKHYLKILEHQPKQYDAYKIAMTRGLDRYRIKSISDLARIINEC